VIHNPESGISYNGKKILANRLYSQKYDDRVTILAATINNSIQQEPVILLTYK